MPTPPKPIELDVSAGGRLITQSSQDSVDPRNYVRKVNFRRVARDKEGRVEGWIKFRPDIAAPAALQSAIGAGRLKAFAELVRPNQERVVVAASATTIKKFDTATNKWTTIGSGFSANAKRWQWLTINGWLVMNNGVDLPVTYRVESGLSTSIIVTAAGTAGANGVYAPTDFDGGTAIEYTSANDYVIYRSEILGLYNWHLAGPSTPGELGEFRQILYSTAVGPGPSLTPIGLQFIVSSGAAPAPQLDYANAVEPIHELRENGVASVGFIEEVNGILLCADITEIKASELNGIMNGATPYGIVAEASKLNRITFRVIEGERGFPRMWAPKFVVTQVAAGAVITLPFPSSVFVAGETRVAVLNAGPNGGVLGGQSDSVAGVLVTAVDGNEITLAKSTDVGLTYPRQVTIMRWSDQSSLVGAHTLQEDSSPIVGFKKLNSSVVIYRPKFAMTGRYTGVSTNPWDFKMRTQSKGYHMPKWHEAIVTLGGEVHLYPAVDGYFYTYDGVSPRPEYHVACNDVRDYFFDGLTEASDVWAFDHPITHQIYFCRPGWTLTYDYDFNTAAEMDIELHTAGFVQRPGGVEQWVVLGIEGNAFTYGMVKMAANDYRVLTYLRDGVNAEAFIKFGLTAIGSAFIENDLSCYLVKMASDTPQITLQLKLWQTRDARVTPTLLLTNGNPGPTYQWQLFYRGVYFQDELRVTSTADQGMQFTGRAWVRAPINSVGMTRGI